MCNGCHRSCGIHRSLRADRSWTRSPNTAQTPVHPTSAVTVPRAARRRRTRSACSSARRTHPNQATFRKPDASPKTPPHLSANPRPASLSLSPAGGGRGCVKPGLSLDVAQVESIAFHAKGLRFVWSRFNYRSPFSGESRSLTSFRPTFFSHNPLSSYDTGCGIGSM